MSKSVLPWSLKGITPEAREIAKKAAAEKGMTIGEWVSEAIRDVGPERSVGSETVLSEIAPASGESEHRIREAIRARIYEAEEQVAHIVGPLQDVIEQMNLRLTRLEEEVADDSEAAENTSDQRRLDSW